MSEKKQTNKQKTKKKKSVAAIPTKFFVVEDYMRRDGLTGRRGAFSGRYVGHASVLRGPEVAQAR